MQELIKQYKKTRKAVVTCIRTLKLRETEASCSEILELKQEESICNSILRDLDFAIDWMEKGHSPESKGIETWGAYIYKMPTQEMAKYFRSIDTEYEWDKKEARESILTSTERYAIETALSELSEREKEVFLMKFGACMSYTHISEILKIDESTTRRYVLRARRKIEEVLNNDMFLRVYKMGDSE